MDWVPCLTICCSQLLCLTLINTTVVSVRDECKIQGIFSDYWWVTSTLRHVLGSGNTLSVSTGTWLTGKLTPRVLVCARRTLDTLLLLSTVERPHTTARWGGRHRVVLPVAPNDFCPLRQDSYTFTQFRPGINIRSERSDHKWPALSTCVNTWCSNAKMHLVLKFTDKRKGSVHRETVAAQRTSAE